MLVRALGIDLLRVFKVSDLILHLLCILRDRFLCVIVVDVLQLPLNLLFYHIDLVLVYLLYVCPWIGVLVHKLKLFLPRAKHVVFLRVQSLRVTEIKLIYTIKLSSW